MRLNLRGVVSRCLLAVGVAAALAASAAAQGNIRSLINGTADSDLTITTADSFGAAAPARGGPGARFESTGLRSGWVLIGTSGLHERTKGFDPNRHRGWPA